MDFLKVLRLAAAGGVVALLTTAAASPNDIWPRPVPADSTVLPVLTTGWKEAGGSIRVCMYNRAQPREYPLMGSICRDGATGCTAFVAVPNHEAEVLIAGYDLTNPPVEATGSVCDLPRFIPSPPRQPASR